MKSRLRTKTQAPNGVCEASKCFAKATTIVRVSAGVIAGHQISIPLSLCGNCVRKFDIIKEKEGVGPGQAQQSIRQYATHSNASPKPIKEKLQ